MTQSVSKVKSPVSKGMRGNMRTTATHSVHGTYAFDVGTNVFAVSTNVFDVSINVFDICNIYVLY
jgi:hypothetical protein